MKKVEARLLLGDCREELKKLADNSIDLEFTSPPYQSNGTLKTTSSPSGRIV